MTDQHPIVPSFEMAHQWHKETCKDPYNGGRFIESKTLKYIATKAAQWGADQELEACCKYMQHEDFHGFAKELRAVRRPKPPSLKEQALESLTKIEDNKATYLDASIVRAALEALPND